MTDPGPLSIPYSKFFPMVFFLKKDTVWAAAAAKLQTFADAAGLFISPSHSPTMLKLEVRLNAKLSPFF